MQIKGNAARQFCGQVRPAAGRGHYRHTVGLDSRLVQLADQQAQNGSDLAQRGIQRDGNSIAGHDSLPEGRKIKRVLQRVAYNRHRRFPGQSRRPFPQVDQHFVGELELEPFILKLDRSSHGCDVVVPFLCFSQPRLG